MELHSKFKIDGKISYQTLNALNIGDKEKFNFVLFKSVMGGVSYGGKNENKQKLMDEIYESLKPGGYLMFCENLSASPLHRYFRKKFVKWGKAWNYLKYEELELLCSKFEDVKIETYGFWGAMGRNELQRNILGIADIIFSPFIPKSQRYIAFVTAKKPL
jgi:SAM-dependent methyltransferase